MNSSNKSHVAILFHYPSMLSSCAVVFYKIKWNLKSNYVYLYGNYNNDINSNINPC